MKYCSFSQIMWRRAVPLRHLSYSFRLFFHYLSFIFAFLLFLIGENLFSAERVKPLTRARRERDIRSRRQFLYSQHKQLRLSGLFCSYSFGWPQSPKTEHLAITRSFFAGWTPLLPSLNQRRQISGTKSLKVLTPTIGIVTHRHRRLFSSPTDTWASGVAPFTPALQRQYQIYSWANLAKS